MAAPVRITWRQALAWRMGRQLLVPLGKLSPPEVVDRLCGVQAQVASSAELAIRLRQQSSKPGAVARDIGAGRLIKTWAMRGALHLLTPDQGGRYLSLIAAGRSWERPVWQRYFGVSPADMDKLREVVTEVLGDEALTREELIAGITAKRRFRHMGEAMRSGWGTVLKPLAWQGDIVFGPSRGRNVTFMRPNVASPTWAGVPDADESAPDVIVAYLSVYGPATIDRFDNWLAGGGFGRKRLRGWFDSAGDRLATVEVDGEEAYAVATDVDELAATKPTSEVRLLGGFDQYVLGPGTADGHVTAATRRSKVSLQSGWISPVVIAGGAVAGTWVVEDETLDIAWFSEAGRVPRNAIDSEGRRLGNLLGRPLNPSISILD
ncbi:MAG TPA: crosslink repair DNA glycosylase YcaQ family protein [Candidatus Limnocylindrales bacterium]|nr:crosslink repair DNA glycosylase YcaQ family protein [Candidatus Limnocylindrales bacterium]